MEAAIGSSKAHKGLEATAGSTARLEPWVRIFESTLLTPTEN
jgi:hypothetical protein